jgi:catechol 2,3-dioxygenase-like lactoylglutathione lyase family enzyme
MNTDTYFRGVYPRIINHVAISVPDLEAAINWYTEVLGFTVVKQAAEFVADDSLKGRAVKDIHGPRLKKMKMAWLSSANQVGFEIIEYVEPNAELRQDNFEYWKSGIIHICITDPDIDGLCKRISDSGGKQRTEIWEIVPEKKYKIAFCEDPFGNIIEIFDHSYEQIITSL